MVEANKSYFTPSPKLLKFITETHLDLYEKTGGLIGSAVVQLGEKGFGLFRRMDILVLSTRGRKSGLVRKRPLPYFQYDGRIVVFASNAASEKNPDWYVNLAANPDVEIQLSAAKLRCKAKPLTGADYDDIWRRHTESWPRWNVYAQKTTRKIPIVELVPVG